MPEVPSSFSEMLAAILRPKPQEAEHFEALGRFVSAFAHAESQIHTLARWLSKMDDTRARVVFGGLRVSDAINRVHALLRVPGAPKNILSGILGNPNKADVESVEAAIAQFQVISTTRDKLIHRTTTMQDAGIQVSNIFTAKSLLHAEANFIVTLADLKAMRLDCAVIYLQLSAFQNQKGDGLDGPSYFGPWQYKPPQQVPDKQGRGKGPKGPKRQPRASRG
jgi:hypothetical protein